uniref:AT-hook motif nuclear-localized protein n=1 Tax=Aegilops tauschii subsp. strangulata TaxID=200361 RepID=A0A453J937_AEGTS
MAVSQLNSKAICILSALGSVREAVLVQPSGVILTHKGPLEIIRLSGSILTSNDHRSLRITLASVNSFVISGIIAGPLIAETPVQALLGSFHNNLFSPNNTPRAAIACYPNTQGATGNGSTLPSDRVKPQYASRTSVEQNESDEVDVKPFVGLLNPNPEYASRTPVERNESSEI